MIKSLAKQLKQKYTNKETLNNNEQSSTKSLASKRKSLNLSISECTCPICLEILIEPVEMPCKHEICLNCFETMLDKTNMCCPMCRLRISTWSRIATKNHTLVNKERWKQIQSKFPNEIKQRLDGKTQTNLIDSLSNVIPSIKIPNKTCSEQGEIYKEYQEYIRKEQERLRIEKENEEKLSLAYIEQVIRDEESLSLNDYLEKEQHLPLLTTPKSAAVAVGSRRNHHEQSASQQTPSNPTNITESNNIRITRSQSLRTQTRPLNIGRHTSIRRGRPTNVLKTIASNSDSIIEIQNESEPSDDESNETASSLSSSVMTLRSRAKRQQLNPK